MSTTKPLTSPLIKSGSHIEPRSLEHVFRTFKEYGVKSFAVYVDHTTVGEHLGFHTPGQKFKGFYTFDINLVGTELNGQPVELIRTDGPMPECDGWLVASTSRASAFSLAGALHKTNKEHQIIVRYYSGQTTEISAYMDFISKDSETVIYLQHYYDRKYRIVFPLDIRWKVCGCDGTIKASGQWVIPPGGCVTLHSSDFDLGDFTGYLWVECEVENLQVRVQPFIHFWADYISPSGIGRNHQSGWAPWPPHTVFNRGIMPTDPRNEAYACIYNANDSQVTVNALLHFEKNERESVVERDLKPVPPGQMSYQNLNELFSDVDFADVNGAYVLLSCDKPLHRPNHYIVKKGTFEILDTYHQTGGKSLHWSNPTHFFDKDQLHTFESFDMRPWEVVFPLLEERFQIETWMGLLSLTLSDLSHVIYRVLDSRGREIFTKREKLSPSSPQFMNINAYLEEQGVQWEGKGSFCVTPATDVENVPLSTAFTFALKHKDFPNLCTSFITSGPDVNLPFYVGESLPKSREYQFSPLQVTDHFGPGTHNTEYDSLYIVRHHSLNKHYSETAQYRVEIFDEQGRVYVVHREVGPLTHDAFFLREVLEQAGVRQKQGHYTVWFKSCRHLLKPYIALYRKKDNAISLDDGSEGTLQKDPQIGQIDPLELLSYLKGLGLVKSHIRADE